MMSKEKMSPEAEVIIGKLGKPKAAKPSDDEGSASDESDAQPEAKRAAAEQLFKAISGREPNDREAMDTEDALTAFCEAMGY